MKLRNNIPLVTIITVVYNGAKTLEQTIQSVLNQTYNNIEYIIIDGGSTDGSVEVLKKYSDQLKFWISENDLGIYDAMNKGLKHAQGDLIGIINSDDWYELNAVENIVDAYLSNIDMDIIHGLLRFVNNVEQITCITGHHHSFLKTGMIEHPTCFVKLSLYKRIGLFNTSYKAAADYDFINRAKQNNANFLFLSTVIANFRLGGITSTIISQLEELKLKLQYRHISKVKYLKWFLILHICKFFKYK